MAEKVVVFDELDTVFPKIQQIEFEVLQLFRRTIGARGPTGVNGPENVMNNSIALLTSARNMLIRIAKDYNIPIADFERAPVEQKSDKTWENVAKAKEVVKKIAEVKGSTGDGYDDTRPYVCF